MQHAMPKDFNVAGEADSYDASYSGIPYRSRYSLPLLPAKEREVIVGAAPSPVAGLFNVAERGHPFFASESVTEAMFTWDTFREAETHSWNTFRGGIHEEFAHSTMVNKFLAVRPRSLGSSMSSGWNTIHRRLSESGACQLVDQCLEPRGSGVDQEEWNRVVRARSCSLSRRSFQGAH